MPPRSHSGLAKAASPAVVWLFLAGLMMGVVSNAAADSASPNPKGYFLAPKVFRAAMAKVMPSVVTIETYGGINARPTKKTRGQMKGISKPGEGPTTGVIIGEDDKGTFIVTSTYNFIRKPSIITVVFADGSQHVARQMGSDATRKLTLLKVEGVKGKPVPESIPLSEVAVGQWSISVGVGYGGDDPAMSVGIISAKNRISGKAVQTDANTSPANYGGPLINIHGKVYGICVPLSPRAEGAAGGVEWYDSGIGFAIPLHGMDRLFDQMKQGKSVVPGRIGVMPKPAADGKGIEISKVVPNSGAARAGLKVKDVIVAINNQPTMDMMALRIVLGRFVAGDTIKVAVRRDKEIVTVDVTLTAGGNDVPPPKVQPNPRAKPTPKPAPKPKVAPKKTVPESSPVPRP